MQVTAREPFDFERTLRFVLSPPALLNGRLFEPLLDHFENGEYQRAADLNGQPVLYAVREVKRSSTQTGRRALSAQGTSALKLRVLAGPQNEGTQRALAELVERQFSTSLDLAPFCRLAASDRVLSRLAQHFLGMRIPQAPTVYETLICAILEQQVNLTFAHQVKKALIAAYGLAIEFEGRTYRTFPEPVRLALATPSDLRVLQISGPKARYIIALSRAVLDGRLDLEALRHVEPSQAVERLLREKGIGPWTAHYVGLRALGHLDCLPAADVGLQKVIQRFYGLRQKPTAERVEKIAKAWTGWRSYATFYLWLTYWEDAAWWNALSAEIRASRKSSA